MKIGFVGVGGTGKTTTLKDYQEVTGEEIPVLYSHGRQVWKDFGVTEADMVDNRDYDFALKIQREMFDRRLKLEDQLEDFISDRTLLDTYCYMLMWCHKAMTDNCTESLFVVTLENMKKYDYVFYFPLESFRTACVDGLRAAGMSQAIMLDSLLRGMLEKMYPAFVKMRSGSKEKRVAQIQASVLPKSLRI